MRILSPTYRPPACSRGMENITGFPGTVGKMEILSFISSKINHTFGRFLIVLMVTIMAALPAADISAAAGRVSPAFSGMNKAFDMTGMKLSVKHVRGRRPNDMPLRTNKLENPAVILDHVWVKADFSIDLDGFVLLNGANGTKYFEILGETGGCNISGKTFNASDKTGSYTVRVTISEDAIYQEKTGTITVTATNLDIQMLSFEDSIVTKKMGDAPFFNNLHGYMSLWLQYDVIIGTDTADVDPASGTVTIKAPGTAVIRVYAPETPIYNPAMLAYILYVEKDEEDPDPNNGDPDPQFGDPYTQNGDPYQQNRDPDPLPEDEIGSYVLHNDGTKEYLIFHTYAICIKYLGSDELCRGFERCYHK